MDLMIGKKRNNYKAHLNELVLEYTEFSVIQRAALIGTKTWYVGSQLIIRFYDNFEKWLDQGFSIRLIIV